jgi:hypothetical protein
VGATADRNRGIAAQAGIAVSPRYPDTAWVLCLDESSAGVGVVEIAWLRDSAAGSVGTGV